MPWDLIFYGSMAIIFIGIMVSSARARRERGAADGRSSPAAGRVPRPDTPEDDSGP